MSSKTVRTRVWWNWLAPAVYLSVTLAAGLVLRFDDVDRQLLGGDESHAVRAAQQRGFWGLLTTYRAADHSIPLSLYARALLQADAFTDLRFRLPSMVFGSLLLLSPLLWWRRLGPAAVLSALALCATSPPLVYHSFTARPYAPAAFFTLLAWRAWASWIEAPSPRSRLAFAASAAASIFCHLFCAFPVAALLLVAPTLRREGSPGWTEIARAALLMTVLISLLLGPGASSLYENRVGKVGRSELGLGGLWAAYTHLVGHLPLHELLLIALIVLGAIRLARSAPLLGRSAAAMIGLQVAALVAVRPFGYTFAWARYLFLVWPVALVLAGVGLAAAARAVVRILARREATGRATAATAAVLAAALLAAAVPLASPALLFRPGPHSFRSATFMLMPAKAAGGLPAVYRAILEEGRRGGVLLEHPPSWPKRNRSELVDRQRQHGMYVRFASHAGADPRRSGVHDGNWVDLERASEVAASGAAYLVYRVDRGTPATGQMLRRRYGMPLAEGEGMALFDLAPSSPSPRSAAQEERETPKNLILITVDTWRGDHFLSRRGGVALTPRLAELARSAVVFAQTSSVSNVTSPGIAGILTGLLPRRSGVLVNAHMLPPGLPTLVTALGESGFVTAALVANPVLAPGYGFERDFDHYELIDRRGPQKKRRANELTRRAVEWLEDRPRDRPFLLWLHYMDPHGPYQPPEEFLAYFRKESFEGSADIPLLPDGDHTGKGGIPFYQQYGSSEANRDGRDYSMRYAAEVRFLDHEIGRLLDHLTAGKVLDDSLLIITSDHGEALDDDHGFYFSHANGLTEDQTHVPLLMFYRGCDGGAVVDRPVSTADILPTALELLGVAGPEHGAGEHLLGSGARIVVSQTARETTVRGGPWKMRWTGGKGWWLVNLADDPRELSNLAAAEPVQMERLRRGLTELRHLPPLAESVARKKRPRAERKALEALGYLR